MQPRAYDNRALQHFFEIPLMKCLSKTQLVLQLIGAFGYLSTRDISKLVWAGHEAHSAHVLAQAMLSKLAADGYVLARSLGHRPGTEPTVLKPGMPRGYVLTQKGANILNEIYENEWAEAPVEVGSKVLPWFADGYNLSLSDFVTRAPVIELCHSLQAHGHTLTMVGRRALARNFLGRADLKHFDAALFDGIGKLVFGVYLAHHQTSEAAKEVVKLAKQPVQFLICCDRPIRLPSLQRWRGATNPAMDAYVLDTLPPGVLA